MAIIAILITVLTPVLLGATTRAKDRASQASLRNAATGAKSYYFSKADYTTATPALMGAEIGGLTFVGPAANPSGVNTISMYGFSPTQVFLSGTSKSGMCFYVFDDETAGTTKYAKAAAGGSGCAANGSPIPTDNSPTGWQATW